MRGAVHATAGHPTKPGCVRRVFDVLGAAKDHGGGSGGQIAHYLDVTVESVLQHAGVAQVGSKGELAPVVGWVDAAGGVWLGPFDSFLIHQMN